MSSRTNNTSRTNNASRTSNPSQRSIPYREHQKLKNRLDSLSKSANIYKDLIAILDHITKMDFKFRVPYLKKIAKYAEDNHKDIKRLRDVTKKHIDIIYDRVRKLEGKPSVETSQAASTLAGLGSSSSTSGSSTTTSSGTKRRRTGGKKKRKSRRKRRRKSPKTKRKKKRSKSKTKRRR